LLLVLTGWGGVARGEDCTLGQIAELPIEDNEMGSPIVSILIDDQPRDVLLDTGGFWSLLDPAIAKDFRKRPSPVEARLGLGAIRLNEAVRVPSVQIGPLKATGVDFLVAPALYLSVDGTLGANWLSRMDVEIDPVENKVRLFSKDHCEGAVVHWPHQELAVVEFRRDPAQNRITIPMTLDGQEIRALIDTGEPDTVLSLRAAERLFGLKPGSPGVLPNGTIRGKDGDQPAYRYEFASLDMDGIVIRNPWLTLSPMAGEGPDLILGMRHLRGLHLYFSYGEQRIYATSVTGDMAKRQAENESKGNGEPPHSTQIDRIDAQDRLRAARAEYERHDYDGAAADLDKALAFDPGYARAYVARAALKRTKGDRDGAAQDLGEAIRADPKFAGSYLERSSLFEFYGDYEHAFSDVDQAVKLQPKSAVALNSRCWIGAITGRLDGALADCNAALDLEPDAPPILDSRALVHYKAGRLDKAIADYDAALARAPHQASSLYGRGLAKRQAGDVPAGNADIEAAQQLDPTIAEHFAR
jgi:tetratricopeptide (TPR) repeat protein